MKKKTTGIFVKCDKGWCIDTKVKIDGEWKHFGKKGYSTLAEAKADYKRAEEEFIRKHTKHHAVMTFAELVNEYEEMRSNKVSQSTILSDTTVFKVHMSKYMDLPLKSFLTPIEMKEWHRGIVSMYDMTAKRKNAIISRFKDLMKFAYENRKIDSETYQDFNIIVYTIKNDDTSKVERTIWTDNERKLFYKAISKSDYDNTMFSLFLFLGARIGEFLALKVSSVDFTNKKITIDHQMVYHSNGKFTYTDRLKTKQSYRSIILTEDITKMLMKHIRENGLEKDDFLFQSIGRSTAMSKSVFTRKLKGYCDDAGIRECNPHSIRHMVAVKLGSVANTVSAIEVSARRMGHGTEMFMNTYANHDNDDLERDLLTKISF